MHKSEAESLIDYMYWVNERLLEAAERLTEEAFGSTGPVRSLRQTLVHELDVEWSWRLNLLGTIGDEDDLQAEDLPDVKSLRARWQLDEAEMRAWVGGSSDEDLEREVSSEFTRDRRPLWQYPMFHAAQQQADAAAMLTVAGESPTESGYLEYLRRRSPPRPGSMTFVAHPLVEQLGFTRGEWRRALRGVSEEDGLRRLEPMNSIGWIVGHLAWHEQAYWLTRAQQTTPLPVLNETVATGMPATTPSLAEMRAAWKKVTALADPWLDRLTTADMLIELPHPPGFRRPVGDAIRRMTYHYWFHIGEILAIRQMLGHRRLPEYVGDIESRAPYRPEPR